MPANLYVDDSEESLVPFLKLLLVKDLNGNQAFIGDANLKRLVPVWVQRPFDHRCRVGLFTVHSDDGKWVRKS